MTTHVVIMAGGIGSRLYPLSTPERPKQFLDLLDSGRTLIQLTYDRFLKASPDAKFWVVTSASYVDLVREQLPTLPKAQILAEPMARNTAPCIAYACWKIRTNYPDANIVVTPADAYVSDPDAFAETIKKALDFTANSNAIVTIGIQPIGPNTNYGYIQVKKGDIPASEAGEIVKVKAFKEKPNAELAAKYIKDGGYYWNAGIFVWNVATIESELRAHSPQICAVMDQLRPDLYTLREQESLARLFPTCEKISIDYAVMEKSRNIYTLAASWPWSDLGSFAAIEQITGKQIPQDIKDAQEEYQRSKAK